MLNSEDITPPTYHDLSLMSKREWLQKERPGDRSDKIGEGQGAEAMLQSRRRRNVIKKRSKRNRVDINISDSVNKSIEVLNA